MCVQKNNINTTLHTVLCRTNFYPQYNCNLKIENIHTDIILKTHFSHSYCYNLFLYGKINNIYKIKPKFKFNYEDKLQQTILNVKRTSFTLKHGIAYKYKVTVGIGSGEKWAGIGESKNRVFRQCYLKSANTAKRNVYNLNFNCNDYKQLKYKGSKFKALNMSENRHNLPMYDSLIKISGNKKIKLISHSSKTPINMLKSILHFCR